MRGWMVPALALALTIPLAVTLPAQPVAGALPEPAPCPPKPYQMGRQVYAPRSPGGKAKRRWKRARRGGG